MIAEFERQNPQIKVRVVVDPTGANGARTLRTRAESPDVIRATNFQMPEYVATGALLQLDDLVKRDKIDPSDWLLPLANGMVRGHIYGLQQDYRVPASDLPQETARGGESRSPSYMGRSLRRRRQAFERHRHRLCHPHRRHRRHRRRTSVWRVPSQYALDGA